MNWEEESTPILSRLQEQILQQTNPKINEIIIARERGQSGIGHKVRRRQRRRARVSLAVCSEPDKGKISATCQMTTKQAKVQVHAHETLVYSTATLVLITGSVSEWWTKFLLTKTQLRVFISERNPPNKATYIRGKIATKTSLAYATPPDHINVNMAKRGCNMRCFLHPSPSFFRESNWETSRRLERESDGRHMGKSRTAAAMFFAMGLLQEDH